LAGLSSILGEDAAVFERLARSLMGEIDEHDRARERLQAVWTQRFSTAAAIRQIVTAFADTGERPNAPGWAGERASS
jgi:hypothetical protein